MKEIYGSVSDGHVYTCIYIFKNLHNTSAMLSIFGRGGAILLAIVDVACSVCIIMC